MAGYLALEIEQYATFSRTITVKAADGTAQNLIGYYANTSFRKSHYSTSSNTITTTVSDAVNGVISLSMTAANTGLLAPGRYVYDTVSTAADGTRSRLVEGIIVVNPGATH